MGTKNRKKGIYTILQKTCEYCNKIFDVYPPSRYSKARFCSMSCATRWQHKYKPQPRKGRRLLICAHCNKKFYAWRHEVNRKFCNRECKYAYQRAHTKDINKLRDKGRCQDCGSKRFIETHHIDGNPQSNSLDNLIILCKKCHTHKHILLSNGINFNKTQSKWFIDQEEHDQPDRNKYPTFLDY